MSDDATPQEIGHTSVGMLIVRYGIGEAMEERAGTPGSLGSRA